MTVMRDWRSGKIGITNEKGEGDEKSNNNDDNNAGDVHRDAGPDKDVQRPPSAGV